MDFKALEISENNDSFCGKIINKKLKKLNDSDVLIKVYYSSLNYKDCLSIKGNKGVTRSYPHIPGIDLSGKVVESKSSKWKIGDEVIVTGYDLGMNHDGGFAQYAIVPSKWIIKLPSNLTLKQAMLFGTAGFTARYAVDVLLSNFKNKNFNGPILVTGVGGGVGSIASLILEQLGIKVIAASRNIDDPYLDNFVFEDKISSLNLSQNHTKSLLNRNFLAAIDNLGGSYLANIIKQMDYRGIVISCGNVAGAPLDIDVFPFILRGVTLTGVSSANCPYETRNNIWEKISQFDLWNKLENIIEEINLEQILEKSELILGGKNKGRYLVNLK